MTPILTPAVTWLALGLGTIPTADRLSLIQHLDQTIARLEEGADQFEAHLAKPENERLRYTSRVCLPDRLRAIAAIHRRDRERLRASLSPRVACEPAILHEP